MYKENNQFLDKVGKYLPTKNSEHNKIRMYNISQILMPNLKQKPI